MMKISELSKLSGLSVRTLHYYDEIGLLKPGEVTKAGYRGYGEEAAERLSQIMFFRELGFPLKDIRGILESPSFDRNAALEQQIALLKLRREHLDNLITLAEGAVMLGMSRMDFKAFDTREIDQYMEEAKAHWGQSQAWKEYEAKQKGQTREQQDAAAQKTMDILAEMGRLKAAGETPGSPGAQAAVETLRAHFTENYYNCTLEILAGLGRMYTGDGRFQENIDSHGGPGTAQFAADAIHTYCSK
ncbi:MAG: MerR family transcriptional regulator [Clostridia bacterium]|nr:MerR family transcriptional regulator [Candidatus Pelethousia sp.]NCB29833.1 MerR family transcriptional regulator [Clostridia bacterium]